MGGVWLASDVVAVVAAVDEEELVPLLSLLLVMPLEWAGQRWRRGGSEGNREMMSTSIRQLTCTYRTEFDIFTR